ncbi:MAG: inositol monophosphatase [Verrucomicrobia subdivision 3 bacterium]|nr:inositol monophosphatase [Limisphaerales bacterium]
MPKPELKRAVACAVAAARGAGEMMRKNLRATKKVNEATQHDIKLELDVRCQKRIERALRRAFPQIPVLGEEGITGDPQAEFRWVVDPIDGTVNFTYGIPHACVSIALQCRHELAIDNRQYMRGVLRRDFVRRSIGNKASSPDSPHHQTMLGVVYDPFCGELWTAVRGQPARLNGKPIRVSSKSRLDEAIVSIGFAKHAYTLKRMIPTLNELIYRVRKIRIMGSAALSMVYVASGRMDAYIEYGLRLWDIAAGGLILECAGGDFWRRAVEGEYTYRILASNGRLRRQLEQFTR